MKANIGHLTFISQFEKRNRGRFFTAVVNGKAYCGKNLKLVSVHEAQFQDRNNGFATVTSAIENLLIY